jgi:hypothetical protein
MKTGSQTFPSRRPLFLRHRALLPSLVGSLFLFLCSTSVWGWDSTFFDLFEISTSARAAALGGLHAALADDPTTLFSNTAGLRSVRPQWTFSEVTFSFYDSAAAIAAEAIAGTGGGSADRRGTFSIWGPLALSYVGNGWGFGLFGSLNVYMHAYAPVPGAREMLEPNLVLIGAKAFRIPLPERWQSTLDFGFSLLGFASARGVTETDIRQVLQSSVSPTELLASITDFRRAVGASAEFGFLYSFKDLFSVGLTGRNLSFVQIRNFSSLEGFLGGEASSALYNFLPLDISAGVLFRPPLGWFGRYISDLKLMADYHNIFDFLFYPSGATNPLLHVGVGMEVVLLEIVSLRAGYYQCQPSFGLGLDLSLLTVNIALFGREMSSEPGGSPVRCYSIGLEFKH